MGHTFSSLKIETMKPPLLYLEPYLASFTPRNKKPSHSSFGKTSSKFDLLEIKITRKQNEKVRQSKALCIKIGRAHV